MYGCAYHTQLYGYTLVTQSVPHRVPCSLCHWPGQLTLGDVKELCDAKIVVGHTFGAYFLSAHTEQYVVLVAAGGGDEVCRTAHINSTNTNPTDMHFV